MPRSHPGSSYDYRPPVLQLSLPLALLLPAPVLIQVPAAGSLLYLPDLPQTHFVALPPVLNLPRVLILPPVPVLSPVPDLPASGQIMPRSHPGSSYDYRPPMLHFFLPSLYLVVQFLHQTLSVPLFPAEVHLNILLLCS